MDVVKLINGPEAFTPDNEFILGPTDVRGFWVAAGFCAHGLAGAGGMGKLVAEWIAEGVPSLDVWEMDSRRFGSAYRSRAYTLARTTEVYSTYYDVKYPGHERQAGRPLRVSPAYARLGELGAAFGEKSGWERANWFEPNAAPRRRGAAAEGLGGPALVARDRRRGTARAASRRPCSTRRRSRRSRSRARAPPRSSSRSARTASPATSARSPTRRCSTATAGSSATSPSPGSPRTASGSSPAPRSGSTTSPGSARTRPQDGSVTVADVTSQYACFGLWGPKAREILQPLTPTPLDFPYMRAAELAVGPVPCLVLRVTYVGELGWELYCPSELGLRLWDELWAGGREHGLVAGGYKAIDSLRLEKGYRVWGADITPDDTPFEAGLGFAVKLDKGEFLGREALLGKQEPERRLCCLVLADPRTVALGSEPVRVDGIPVGRVTSGGYGYTVERSIAYAYLPAADAVPGREVEVESFGERVAAEVAAEPLLDPNSERVRA